MWIFNGDERHFWTQHAGETKVQHSEGRSELGGTPKLQLFNGELQGSAVFNSMSLHVFSFQRFPSCKRKYILICILFMHIYIYVSRQVLKNIVKQMLVSTRISNQKVQFNSGNSHQQTAGSILESDHHQLQRQHLSHWERGSMAPSCDASPGAGEMGHNGPMDWSQDGG